MDRPGPSSWRAARPPAVARGHRSLDQAGEQRSAQVESLRALAALGVVVSHVYGYSVGYGASAIFGNYGSRLASSTGNGVYLFFALSGYLLFLPFARHHWAGGTRLDLGRYTTNRALRILPLYYVAAVCFLAAGAATAHQWVHMLTFTQVFFHDSLLQINPPTWSIVSELLFYAVLPLLSWTLARLSRRSMGGAAVLLGVLFALALAVHGLARSDSLFFGDYAPATNAVFFLPGMALALARVAGPERVVGRLPALLRRQEPWIAAGVGLWFVQAWVWNSELLLPACFLVVGACVLPFERGPAARLLECRPLALLGVASYSLYLWHDPVVKALSPVVPGGFAGLLLVSVPLCCMIAAASYLVVERPFLRLRRSWAVRRSAAPAAARVGLSTARGLVLISAGAVVVRAAFVLYERHYVPVFDGGDYVRIAASLVHHHAFPSSAFTTGPTAFRPPLYPLYLAAVFLVTGDSLTAARLGQAVLGGASVALVGIVAYQLWGRRQALAAAGVAAVLPSLVILDGSTMSESVFLPLVFATLAAGLAARRSSRPLRWSLLVGALCGLVLLARPNGVAVLLGAVLLVPITRRGRGWRGWACPAVVVLGALVTVTPWTVRNAEQFHALVPITDSTGINVAGTYNPDSAAASGAMKGAWRLASTIPAYREDYAGHPNENLLSQRLERSGADYALHHPGYAVEVFLLNGWRQLGGSLTWAHRSVLDVGLGGRQKLADLWLAGWLLVAAGGLVGLALPEVRRRIPLGVWLVPALLWLTSTQIDGEARYRAPVELFAAMTAAAAVVALWRRSEARRASPSLALGATGGGLVVPTPVAAESLSR